MNSKFRIGITPDFYTEAKGKFESILEEQLSGASGVETAPMPPQPDKLATSDALNQFDAIFSLALKITPQCLRGFSRLLAADPFVKPEQVAGLGVEMVDIDTLFRESDFVTINTLLNKNTRGLIGKELFDRMKPTAYFINTSRGPIVQHDALVAALREKRIAGAGIDVFPVEPPPPDDPLFSMDNVIVSPHALAWTQELMRDNGVEACQNVLALARGELPGGIVNREVVDRPGFRKKLARYR